MDLITLAANIAEASLRIDTGRKGFAIRGKEREGRILFEDGIALAMEKFIEVQVLKNPQAIILAEYTFLTQELQLCHQQDKATINALTQAIQYFDDAFLSLREVEGTNYKLADNFIPQNKKYRVKGFPKDSFHIACNSHKARIRNMLTATGIDPIEKDLLIQRSSNMTTAINAYVELQRKAMNL